MNTNALNREYALAVEMGLINHFKEAERIYNTPHLLLMAIASRESRMGLALDNWTGDFRNGIGIMQIDKRWHSDFTSSIAPNNNRENIMYGASVLANDFRRFKKWKPAIAAYNAGAKKVGDLLNAGLEVDLATTGGDYSADVIQRWEYFKTLVTKSTIADNYIGVAIAMTVWTIYKLLKERYKREKD